MPSGASTIPELRLSVLTKLIERFVVPPDLVLMTMWSESNAESDTIEWESAIGTRGMTPIVPPGSVAPRIGLEGTTMNAAKAAYWKEKVWLDESLLNNLREPGTREQHQAAQKKLATETQKLQSRNMRRKEWMFAKMIADGGFTYAGVGNVRFSVDYGIPDEHKVTLQADDKWETGVTRNILRDIMDAALTMSNTNGAILKNALFTSEVLKLMVLDEGIQTLLQKSTFGNGDLFTRPKEVLGSLLNIQNMILYDQQYQIRATLTAAVTANSTTVVSVDDTLDFEAGGTLRFYNVVSKSYEEETIASVQHDAGTITVSTAPATSYKAGRDFVTMTKKFLPTNKFIMFADEVEGYPIAEFMNAPFGLGRNFGMKIDQKEEWDPEGLYIRSQNKGLPVLYQNDAIYVLTVT